MYYSEFYAPGECAQYNLVIGKNYRTHVISNPSNYYSTMIKGTYDGIEVQQYNGVDIKFLIFTNVIIRSPNGKYNEKRIRINKCYGNKIIFRYFEIRQLTSEQKEEITQLAIKKYKSYIQRLFKNTILCEDVLLKISSFIIN
jgi:hypothetical protein